MKLELQTGSLHFDNAFDYTILKLEILNKKLCINWDIISVFKTNGIVKNFLNIFHLLLSYLFYINKVEYDKLELNLKIEE